MRFLGFTFTVVSLFLAGGSLVEGRTQMNGEGLAIDDSPRLRIGIVVGLLLIASIGWVVSQRGTSNPYFRLFMFWTIIFALIPLLIVSCGWHLDTPIPPPYRLFALSAGIISALSAILCWVTGRRSLSLSEPVDSIHTNQ